MNIVKTDITTHHVFDSPSAFLAECRRLNIRPSYSSWTGGDKAEEVHRKLDQGDTKYVAEAEAAIAEIMSGLHLEALRNEWEDAVAGCIPNVPAFCAGVPLTMRRKHIVVTEISPIKIFVSLTSSGGVNTATLTRRGVCLLALVIALTRVRPVELWTFNAIDMDSGFGRSSSGGWQPIVDLVKLPTQPIDVGLISYILVNMSFTRGLGYSYNNHFKHDYTHHAPLPNLDKCRKLVGAEPQDVVFPPIHLYEEYSNPTKWVKDRLKKILDLNREQTEDLV